MLKTLAVWEIIETSSNLNHECGIMEHMYSLRKMRIIAQVHKDVN